jgi:hypothetical protein
MKKTLTLFLGCLLLVSCSVQKPTIRKSTRHGQKLVTIAQKIFNQYAGLKDAGANAFDGLNLTADEKKLLRTKLKFDSVTAVYEFKNEYGSSILTDSLVIFSRHGFFNPGVDIVVDVHKKPLGSLPVSHSNNYNKINERIYSMSTPGFSISYNHKAKPAEIASR